MQAAGLSHICEELEEVIAISVCNTGGRQREEAGGRGRLSVSQDQLHQLSQQQHTLPHSQYAPQSHGDLEVLKAARHSQSNLGGEEGPPGPTGDLRAHLGWVCLVQGRLQVHLSGTSPCSNAKVSATVCLQPVASRGLELRCSKSKGELSHTPEALAGNRWEVRKDGALPHCASHSTQETIWPKAWGLRRAPAGRELPGCTSSPDLPSKKQKKPALLFIWLPQATEAKDPHNSEWCSWSNRLEFSVDGEPL